MKDRWGCLVFWSELCNLCYYYHKIILWYRRYCLTLQRSIRHQQNRYISHQHSPTAHSKFKERRKSPFDSTPTYIHTYLLWYQLLEETFETEAQEKNLPPRLDGSQLFVIPTCLSWGTCGSITGGPVSVGETHHYPCRAPATSGPNIFGFSCAWTNATKEILRRLNRN